MTVPKDTESPTTAVSPTRHSDGDVVGDVMFRLDTVRLFLSGLRKIKDRLTTSAKILTQFDIQSSPLDSVLDHIDAIIRFHDERLNSRDAKSFDEIYAPGVSYGSLRLMKAGMLTEVRSLEQKRDEILQKHPDLSEIANAQLAERIETLRNKTEMGVFNGLDVPSLLLPPGQPERSTESRTKTAVVAQAIESESRPYYGLFDITDDELRGQCESVYQLRVEETKRGQSARFDTLIREIGVVVESRIRKKARLPKDSRTKGGVSLAEYVFTPNDPILRLDERLDVQQGVMFLFSGFFSVIRNDPAHRLMPEITERQVRQICAFADYLLAMIERAKRKTRQPGDNRKKGTEKA